MGLTRIILTCLTFSSLYHVLHYGLLMEYPQMFAYTIEALGFSYLSQKIYDRENSNE